METAAPHRAAIDLRGLIESAHDALSPVERPLVHLADELLSLLVPLHSHLLELGHLLLGASVMIFNTEIVDDDLKKPWDVTAGFAPRFGLGIDYSVLKEIHPGLIYLSVSGFGNIRPSPYSTWPAYAPIAEAMGGFYESRREEGERPRLGPAGALGDIGSSLCKIQLLIQAQGLADNPYCRLQRFLQLVRLEPGGLAGIFREYCDEDAETFIVSAGYRQTQHRRPVSPAGPA